jgi:hypothetical protein
MNSSPFNDECTCSADQIPVIGTSTRSELHASCSNKLQSVLIHIQPGHLLQPSFSLAFGFELKHSHLRSSGIKMADASPAA